MSNYDTDVEDVFDESCTVEEGVDMACKFIEKAQDYLKWVHPDENTIIMEESLNMALEILEIVYDRLGDVHFELDFSEPPRLH